MTRGILLGLALAWAGPAGAGAAADRAIETSESCGLCHRAIYRTWRESAHAAALEDPIFLEAYRETQSRSGKAVAGACLGCHAPLVEINGDHALEERLTWEGVSCAVCHSLVAVDLSGRGPRHTLEPGGAKRGPVENAPATAHEVAYSELHTTSLACAWCHEWTNAEGTPIMTTYSEWKASPWASAGRTCQSCHMGESEAAADDPRAERVAGARINLHRVPGGHSLEQLHQALSLGIDPAREAEALRLDVLVRNKGAGHAVPTGMPGRRVILEAEVRSSDGETFQDRRVYEKSFVAADGKPIVRDSGFFAPGVKLEQDTRIRPGEERRETFRFAVPVGATAYVTVKLHYEHDPTGNEDQRTWITFFAERRTLVPQGQADR
jgi:hypothetical protein